VTGVPRPANRTEAFPSASSEEVRVHSSGPVLPVISLIVGLRAQREVVGVQAQAVVTPVPDDLIPPDDGPLQDAVDEPVGVGLATLEDDLTRSGGLCDDAAGLGKCPVGDE
jgi:hypothetical protein